MAKRRPLFESLEDRLCMASPVFQTSFELPQQGSWTATVYRSSPLFVDIFGTGKDNLITVAANAKLIAYASNPDGSASPVVTYQVPGGVADIKSTPIVVTDPRNGRKELFAAMGRDEGNNGSLEDGRVFGWDLQTGQLLPGWTQGQSTGRNVTGFSGVYGALTSGQLENNGMPDIVVTSFSHNVTAFRLDGSTLWQWTNDDTILSAAVVGDIDRDGRAEVVVGGDSSNSAFFRAGGWVSVLSNTGVLKWRKYIPGEVTWSSPVLADLQNNGYLDIVIGTGLNYDVTGAPGARALGNNIYAIDPFGNTLPGWPYHTTSNDAQAHEVLASPIVADLMGNGQLEVIAIDRAGFLHVVQPNGQALPGFQGGKPIAPGFAPGSLPDDYASPIVADVTGSGSLQIIASSGPFFGAFDRFGNEVGGSSQNSAFATTFGSPGGPTPEGIDAAAVVGNFYGGPGLALAFVSYNPFLQNRPDFVQIYRLPPSNVPSPWASNRRTVDGVAVQRSPTFDHSYVAAAFNTVYGFIPAQSVLQPYENVLNNNILDLLGTALIITNTQTARQAEVQRLYQQLLGRGADPGGLSSYTNFLATHAYRDLIVQLASSNEFINRAGGAPDRVITLLYQTILGRTPSQAEVQAWVNQRQPSGNIAAIMVNSQEFINNQLVKLYPPAFGPGAQARIPADAVAAFTFDTHRGGREEFMIASLLASGSEYAATSFQAGYVQDMYRDILHRYASQGEIANWLYALDNGSVALTQLPALFLNGQEARDGFIQQQFLAFVGHLADPGTVANLRNYANRESIIIFLVGSPEYYNRNGGTASSFVQAAFRDLASITIDQANLNAYVNQLNNGFTTAQIAQEIIYGGPLYFNNTIVNLLLTYLPDQRLGVLRSGNLPPNAAGQPINPDPNLINYLMTLHNNGYSDEQLISTLLTSPTYFGRVAYYKGIARSPGIRI